MNEPFDWAGLAYQTSYIYRHEDQYVEAAADYLRERIEKAFVPVETYHRDTGIRDVVAIEATARAEAAEARVKVLEEALRELRGYGCPVCNGDCGSANPPVISCPMQRSSQALGGEHE